MIVFILFLYVLANTVAWMKSDDPYSFRVHFFFLFYMFSEYKTFNQWYTGYINIIKSTLFKSSYEVNAYIIRILYNNYRQTFIDYQIYDIKIRRKDGYKVYLYGYSNKSLDVHNMEMDLFDRLHTKVEVIYIQQSFFK